MYGRISSAAAFIYHENFFIKFFVTPSLNKFLFELKHKNSIFT